MPAPWVAKAYYTSLAGHIVVGLLRHDPSTQWWQEWIAEKTQIIPVPYRIHFKDPTLSVCGAYNFPSAIVLWLGDLSVDRPGRENL